MVVRKYIDFLILLIPTTLVSVLFYSSIPTFCSFKKFFYIYTVTESIYIYIHVLEVQTCACEYFSREYHICMGMDMYMFEL